MKHYGSRGIARTAERCLVKPQSKIQISAFTEQRLQKGVHLQLIFLPGIPGRIGKHNCNFPGIRTKFAFRVPPDKNSGSAPALQILFTLHILDRPEHDHITGVEFAAQLPDRRDLLPVPVFSRQNTVCQNRFHVLCHRHDIILI